MNAILKYVRLCLVMALVWLAGFSVEAQNDNSENLTNAALDTAAAVISNAVAQFSEFIPTNDVASNGVVQTEQSTDATNVVIETNLPTGGANVQPGPNESRRDWRLRQRAGTPDTNETGRAGNAFQTNVVADSIYRPVKPEYAAFKLITERNIFDPNRVPRRRGGPVVKAPIVESFGLVGVMSYDKGTFAFFDGSSSAYKKAVKVADSIAGYKVTNIDANTIKLAAGTNHVELRVGMQLRREEGGDWAAAAQSETYAFDSTSTAAAGHSDSTASTASGAESDVLERLRKRRDQE